jgi:hypothetical protein
VGVVNQQPKEVSGKTIFKEDGRAYNRVSRKLMFFRKIESVFNINET